MPVERKPLFRPDMLRVHLGGFRLPAEVETCRANLEHWAKLIASGGPTRSKSRRSCPECRDNPQVARHDVLTATQKLVDRILFSAFCEDRGLRPADTIRKTYEHRDPYRPRPIWETFGGLFQAINRSNAALGILRAVSAGRAAGKPASPTTLAVTGGGGNNGCEER